MSKAFCLLSLLLSCLVLTTPVWAKGSLADDVSKQSELWGLCFQEVSPRVRGLVRTTEGLNGFEKSRIAKFKVHTRFQNHDLTKYYLFKSNRLYLTEWRFWKGDDALVKSLVSALSAVTKSEAQRRDVELPKANPFRTREGVDYLWQTGREQVNLRVVRSRLMQRRKATVRIYLTFRAKDSVMPPSPRQLQADEQMAQSGDEASLLFLGGLPVDPSFFKVLGNDPAVVSKRVWTGLAPTLKQADLTIGFLETPLTYSDKRGLTLKPKKADPAWIHLLQEAGIDLVGLSAPSMMDYRAQGLLDTKDLLKNAGIFSVGAGKDLAEARLPVAFVSRGITIGFVGFYAEEDQALEDKALEAHVGRAGLAGHHKELDALSRMVQTDVSNLASQVDVTVALFHWGEGEGDCGSVFQRNLADIALKAGATLVVGQTPAGYQNVSERSGGVVFFGLADLFGDKIPSAGHLLEVSVNKRGVTGYRFLPLASPDEKKQRAVPRLLEGSEKENAEAHYRQRARQCQ